jgi:hypothetical protein
LRCLGDRALRLFLTGALAGATALGAARAAADEADAAGWARRVTKGGRKGVDALLACHDVAVLQSVKGGKSPRFRGFDQDAVGEQSFFAAVSPADAALTFQLNALPDDVQGESGLIDTVFAWLDVDAVAVTPEQGTWRLLLRAKGGARSEVTAPKPPRFTPTSFVDWVHAALGYDAVVVAVDGDRILAYGDSVSFAPGRQAIVVADSAKQSVVDGSTARAAAIVEVKGSDGPWVVLRKVIGRSAGETGEAVVPGAKLQFSTGR